MARYRALDESSQPRQHYEYVDHEGLVDEGSRWLWETVAVGDETVAVKQIVMDSSGTHRYWWRLLEDDAGGLTDQPLDLAGPGLSPVPRSTFYLLWNGSADAGGGA
ncbi:hypothetical protein [Lentzea sp. NPDC060358]|uniref:hypothetical protein n=1 Tax=Lentzea sp. NPDC060358 TaxID=3347103 RepID=UPI00365FE6E0